MLNTIKYYKGFAILLFFPIFIISGCGNDAQVQNPIQPKSETQEKTSLMTPQYELVETPKYKELKEKVEKARDEVHEIEIERSLLLIKYTEEYFKVKNISKELKEAKKQLAKLEQILEIEKRKLETRPKYPLV